MLSALASIGCGALAMYTSAIASLRYAEADFYRNLPEHTISELPYIFLNPSQEMIDNAPVIIDEETGEELIQVPQKILCTVTGLTASLHHEIVPSIVEIQRKKNAAMKKEYEENQARYVDKQPLAPEHAQVDQPDYLDKPLQPAVDPAKPQPKSLPICLSNVIDTQIWDTIVVKTPEKYDSRGHVTQEATYSINREEKAHDRQEMGHFLRIIDPIEKAFFSPYTHQYQPPLSWIVERERILSEKFPNHEVIKTVNGDELMHFMSTEDRWYTTADLMKATVDDIPYLQQRLKIQKEISAHRPKKNDTFPPTYITLPRSQLDDELFHPTATHLSMSPNAELESVIAQGEIWTKVDKPRLVGLKRQELSIPTFKHLTIIGELYRDYDETIRVRNMLNPETRTFYDPIITYKTRWECCDELESSANKYAYASYGFGSLSFVLGMNAMITATNSLSHD